MFPEIFNNKMTIAGILAVGIILLLYIIYRICKKSAAKKDLRQLAEDRMREETLDTVLLNSYKKGRNIVSESVPYEVDYSHDKKMTEKYMREKADSIMIQLTEHNELSLRKHMMSLDKDLCIGSNKEKNSIVIAGLAPYQCEIFQYNKNVYLRDLGGNQMTILQRGKKNVYAEKKGMRLQTGDRIVVGKVFFEITIIK